MGLMYVLFVSIPKVVIMIMDRTTRFREMWTANTQA